MTCVYTINNRNNNSIRWLFCCVCKKNLTGAKTAWTGQMLYTCITGHRTRQLAVHHRDVVVVVGVEGVVV